MSKALKGCSRKEIEEERDREPKTVFGKSLKKALELFKEYVYYPVDHFRSRNWERLTRSLAFAIHGWMHYDFESAYIYDLMAFKMKRVLKCLETGHAIQEDEDINALKEAIEICERLFNGNYDDKYHEEHNKKWGEIESEHIPIVDADGKVRSYRWETARSGVKTPAQEKKERKEFMKTWENGEKDRVKDLNRLNEILIKHEPSWWD